MLGFLKKSKTNRLYAKVLAIASAAALTASFWQAAERINMLKNPSLDLSCNINPVVDCGSVMSHRLAALFGFPNAFIGMVMFSMLLLAGLLLLSGNVLNKKAMNVVLLLATLAAGFSVWFFGASLYVIGKVCIFCLVIWPASLTLFWFTLLEWLGLDKRRGWLATVQKFGEKYRYEVLIAVFVAMALLYFYRFREFYF